MNTNFDNPIYKKLAEDFCVGKYTDEEFKSLVEEIRPPLKEPLIAEKDRIKSMPQDELMSKAYYDHDASNDQEKAIAIIGMSGFFPGSDSIEDFCEKIEHQESLFVNVPSNHFPEKEIQKRYGAFLDNIAGFDNELFKIPSVEAEYMDPRQRLLLMSVWHTLEDACYLPSQINQSIVDVYIASEGDPYTSILMEADISPYTPIGMSSWALPNRISHSFNFKGKSLSINTACSGSSVALYKAIQALRQNEADYAVVGAANLFIGSGISIVYLGQESLGILGNSRSCYPFQKNAKGFLPAEGIITVLLKKYSHAVRDNDNIHAVLLGAHVNHTGGYGSLTMPSADSQSDAITNAYLDANIAPSTVTYIEAHGASSLIADVEEIKAFKMGEKKLQKQFECSQDYPCKISTIKPNIGHANSASGLMSLIRVIHSLKVKKKLGIKDFSGYNDQISLENTRFYINDETESWERIKKADGSEIPRRAAINNFGAGGVNAHLLVEEYCRNKDENNSLFSLPENKNTYFLALSGLYEEQLIQYANFISHFLPHHPEVSPEQLEYFYLTTRKPLRHRVVFRYKSFDELNKKLKKYTESKGKSGYFFKNDLNNKNIAADIFQKYSKFSDFLKTVTKETDKTILFELWIYGIESSMDHFYKNKSIAKLSLPRYPFKMGRFWIEPSRKANLLHSQPYRDSSKIHPLLHRNTSTFTEQRFSSTFTGEEFFLSDHVVKSKKVLPGVAHLELVRVALDQAADPLEESQTSIQLKNVGWIRPIIIEDKPTQIHIGLFPEENGQIHYEIYGKPEISEEELHVYSTGTAILSDFIRVPPLNLSDLQSQMNKDNLDPDRLYSVIKEMGINLGPKLRGIKKLYIGENQVLAELTLPSSILETQDQFVLHPSLMDSTLQASIGLPLGSSDALGTERKTNLARIASSIKLSIPFALEELEITGKCTASMWTWIRYADGSGPEAKIQKLDIDLCDELGNICARMKGYSSRVLGGEISNSRSSEVGTLLAHPLWKDQRISVNNTKLAYSGHWVMLCEFAGLTPIDIETQIPGSSCRVLQTKQEAPESRFRDYAIQVFEEIQRILKGKAKENVLIQIVVPLLEEQQLFCGLSGLLKTAQLENPKLLGQLVEIGPHEDAKEIIAKLRECSQCPSDRDIRYQKGQRFIAGWSNIDDVHPDDVSIPWKEQGIYLITGGMGGLGHIFAKEIAQMVKDATVILIGRSPLDKDKRIRIMELEALGARVKYMQMDVTNKTAVADVIQKIKEDFGCLHGIIHSAGIIQNNFIFKKSREEIQDVLAPKVSGLVNLDQATKDLSLDFFIFFSSVAGTMGNPGLADYAAANAFMDAYAAFRNQLVNSKQRRGQTLSINWPFWKEGGMKLDEEIEKMMMANTGLVALQTSTGIQALYQGLASGRYQVMVLEGNKTRIQLLLQEQQSKNNTSITPVTQHKTSAIPERERDMLQDKAANYLKGLLSPVIKLPPHLIEVDAPMEKYGIDSLMVMQLTNQLEKTFGSLSKTLFFEYPTILELTSYFLKSHSEQLTPLLAIKEDSQTSISKTEVSVSEADSVKPPKNRLQRHRFSSPQVIIDREKVTMALDIAVIGVSGRYPKSNNIQEFWENLKNGKDCITEIPNERWDHSLYFDKDKNKLGKTYSKWGGFLDGVDQFDPFFFGISPREAEIMDPQERLFLECVVETLEDGGYTRKALSQYQGGGLMGNVGVYVGVMFEEYQLYGAQETILGRPIALSGSPSSIANRVSYFYDFHGPCMAVDTMCSSSLTAIHLACHSLQRAECELAIAGGVNITIHPNKYLILAQGKFASSKGRCESFGVGGDGYVPGEGVGAVLLKPMSGAIRDGDQIYGIIKGTAINHGGKTNGYSVPNPNAQANVIGQAFSEAGINPRTISYLEAHGTGTSLGDPIEITALNKSFENYTLDKQFCAMGSVKSNVGHCESAAGIAGVTKVLLQLKYAQLVPSLHSRNLNPNIDFAKTPFVVQQQLDEWKRPMIKVNGEIKEYPRIAGISSFGAGGSNAHVILEEYIEKGSEFRVQGSEVGKEKPVLIVLSAKNEERLKEAAKNLLTYLEKAHFDSQICSRAEQDEQYRTVTQRSGNLKSKILNLTDLAYTLQIGREAMEERLGLIVESITELVEKLHNFLEGREDFENLCTGRVRQHKEASALFSADEDMAKTIDAWITKRKYSKILDLWVKGMTLDWNKLHREKKPRRISLPTYPFARERYWVPVNSNQISVISNQISEVVHPLLHKNTSDLSIQRFSSIFTGQEFFFANHTVKGEKILPEAVYLEMARAAVEKASGSAQGGYTGICLKDVVWGANPFIVNHHPSEVHIDLFPGENGRILYEIYSNSETAEKEPIVHGQGVAVLSSIDNDTPLNLTRLQTDINQYSLSSNEYYEIFKSIGVDCAAIDQSVEKVFIGKNQVLAKLSLPSSVTETRDQFVLHPGIVESALQASIGLKIRAGDNPSIFGNGSSEREPFYPFLPFKIEAVDIHGSCQSFMWVWIRHTDNDIAEGKVKKLDIDLCDDRGAVSVRMKGVSLTSYNPDGQRLLNGKVSDSSVIPDHSEDSEHPSTETLLFHPQWKEKSLSDEAIKVSHSQHVVILCERNEVSSKHLRERMDNVEFFTLKCKMKNIDKIFQNFAVETFKIIQDILKEQSGQQKVLVQVVIPDSGEQHLFSGLSGLLKTAHLENPNLLGQLIEVNSEKNSNEIIELLLDNSRAPLDQLIRYQGGKRHVGIWRELKRFQEVTHHPWRDRGVYLITGGAGGLGLIFAREIAQKAKNVTLILTGRSPIDDARKKHLKALQELGAQAEYKQVDVTDKMAVFSLAKQIRENFSRLHGIIHSAGIIQDNFILKKDPQELEKVLAAKVSGLVNLDQASKDFDIDVVILFSSVAAGLGSPGQADYATGNAFMDAYATYRNKLVAAKQRQGQTLSVNWPLWKDGGMQINEETEVKMRQQLGMVAIETESGIQALYQSIASGRDQVLVLEGASAQIRKHLLDAPSKPGPHLTKKSMPHVNPKLLRDKTLHQFKTIFGEIIKLDVEKIDVSEPLTSYGIDSVMISQLNLKLADIFDERLSQTLFYQYETLNALTTYLINEYPEGCIQWTGLMNRDLQGVQPAESHFSNEFPVLTSLKSGKKAIRKYSLDGPDNRIRERIAIIGLSGRYPQARTMDEYWENLQAGKDCITEIPEERWDWKEFYHENSNEAKVLRKSCSKWGGFLDGVDQFDPLFFNMTPREAENIDPQERLFLEECWKALEDAGYAPSNLPAPLRQRTGVFAGITKQGFNLYSVETEDQFPTTSFSSLVNRVSYFLNLQGPSIPVDTMCSSTLVAIHEACEYIRNGKGDLAIAGGVNLYLHPSTYLGLSVGMMISNTPNSTVFGKGGTGFVPGEGVGVVILKPYDQALKDGDSIYAVIQGTAVNHNGKTNGYAAPNPHQQASVIRQALEHNNIDHRSISYIEAAASGSELADALEMNALTEVFSKRDGVEGNYRIGSVKSNIGHCEAASGIAQLTKVILALKYKILPPTRLAEDLNPSINFNQLPFQLQREVSEWNTVTIDGVTGPRRAGITSVGAGGVNAHMIVEEFVPESTAPPRHESNIAPVLFSLSAKNKNRLEDYVKQWITYLKNQQRIDMENITYTLQIGREAMTCRFATVVESQEELIGQLEQWDIRQENTDCSYFGDLDNNIGTIDGDVPQAITNRDLCELAKLWVGGHAIPWTELWQGKKMMKVANLPSYPFAGRRCWIRLNQGDHANGNGEAKIIDDEFYRNLYENIFAGDLSERQFEKLLMPSK